MGSCIDEDHADDVLDPGTSSYMSGTVAVALVTVAGRAVDNLTFTPADMALIYAKVQSGLALYPQANPLASISFTYELHSMSLTVPSNATVPVGGREDSYWLAPVMEQLGYNGATDAAVLRFVQDVRRRNGTRWAFALFVTRYSLGGSGVGHATRGGPTAVVAYPPPTWGTDNLDRLVAHQVGHVFGAADESPSSKCTCTTTYGRWRAQNGNCAVCAPGGGVPCLMGANAPLTLCDYTKWHIGWHVWRPSFSTKRPQLGIGGYDLMSVNDRAFSYDYDSSGKDDHVVLFRAGDGVVAIMGNQSGAFSPSFPLSRSGVGGFDFSSTYDQGLAFDFKKTGKQDHLVFYRPGSGKLVILAKGSGNTFAAVATFQNGLGGWDLKSTKDLALAFDFASVGRADHLVLYRPGDGAIMILQHAGSDFSPVFTWSPSSPGIGGYDLAENQDRIVAFDYNHTGRLDHLVLYRPGEGTVWIVGKNSTGTFVPVYRSTALSRGIGGYDLTSSADLIEAVDFEGSGKRDHLLLYRPGKGLATILKNVEGTFVPVFQSETGASGIGGYDLLGPTDRAFAFDFASSGLSDHVVFYRPGTGTFWDLTSGPSWKPPFTSKSAEA